MAGGGDGGRGVVGGAVEDAVVEGGEVVPPMGVAVPETAVWGFARYAGRGVDGGRDG